MDLEAELVRLFLADGPQHVHFVDGQPIPGGNLLGVIADRLLGLLLISATTDEVAGALRSLQQAKCVLVLGPKNGDAPVFAGLPRQRWYLQYLRDGGAEPWRPVMKVKGQSRGSWIESSLLAVWRAAWRRTCSSADEPDVGLVNHAVAPGIARELGMEVATVQRRIKLLKVRRSCAAIGRHGLKVWRPLGEADPSPVGWVTAKPASKVKARPSRPHPRRRPKARRKPKAKARRAPKATPVSTAEHRARQFAQLLAQARLLVGDVPADRWYFWELELLLEQRLGVNHGTAIKLRRRLVDNQQ